MYKIHSSQVKPNREYIQSGVLMYIQQAIYTTRDQGLVIKWKWMESHRIDESDNYIFRDCELSLIHLWMNW